MIRYTPENITSLAPNETFVFGSNSLGHHGAGAARAAYEKFGAVWGNGYGLQGQSYAIDTMSGWPILRAEIDEFIVFAGNNIDTTFLVTKIGCGIAGYTPEQIAPRFRIATSNVVLPFEFEEVLYS